MVQEIKSEEEFDAIINSGKIVIVDFWATWCGPCRFISPIFEKLAAENPNDGVYYGKVDVDQLDGVAAKVGIRAMPTFIVFKNGQRVNDLVGADQQRLTTLVQGGLSLV